MPHPATRSLGRYDLVDFLGAGGMGEVWRAYDRTSGQVVALKRLRADSEAATRDRFRREADVHLGVQHPHVARAYHFIETHEGLALVLEYVDGPTLAEYVARYGPLDFQAALPLFRPVVDAVAFLHRQGILHRDIKPENVRLTRKGVPKLLDFGIAKDTKRSATRSSAVIGSTPYMAPERLAGHPAVPQTDVWALGVLLYEMMTRVCPFDGDNVLDVHDRIRAARYEPLTRFNARADPLAEALVHRCLQRDPAARFADADALLAAVLAAEGVAVPTSGPAALPPTRPDRDAAVRQVRRALPWVGAATGLAVLLVAGRMALRPGAETASLLPPADTVSAAAADVRTVCLRTMDGRQADVFGPDGESLGTLGSGCVNFTGHFGQTYNFTIQYGGQSIPYPVTITSRDAWPVQLP